MKVKEMIEELQLFDPEMDVLLMDDKNGCYRSRYVLVVEVPPIPEPNDGSKGSTVRSILIR